MKSRPKDGSSLLKSSNMQGYLYVLAMVLLVFACETDVQEQEIPPRVSIQSLEVEEGNDEAPVYVTIKLDKASSENVVVILQSEDETAEGGVDYRALNNYPIEFLPGDVQNNLKLDIYGDEMHEEDESFIIRVVSPLIEGEDPAEARVTLLNDDRDTALIIPESGYQSPANYDGYDLLWSDEFDEGSDLENNWTYETGGSGWGNNEWQYYRRENTHIHEGGFLVIEAKEEYYGGKNYTSSRIITRDKFEFKYGRVDIRANLPYGQGIWPALWMLGSNYSSVGWPACGEVDIMELVGHQPAVTHGTVHWSQGGSHAQFGGSKQLSSGIFNDEFHVFSIIWDETHIEWLLDGVKFHGIDIRSQEMSEFHQDYFFIFNVAVGGNWPGYPNQTTEFPQRMIVDYIRVFQ